MINRRSRNVAILIAILALVLAACGPTATPTPTIAPTSAPTEEAVAEATAEAVEATEEAVVEATEEAVVEATEEAVVEATEETVVEATEEAVVEATEEAVVEATEEAVVEATEEAVVVEATEEAVVVEATEEAVVEATEEAVVEATEEAVVEATEEPIPSFDDGAGFVFQYPAEFELQTGNGLYRLTNGDQLIVVISPTAYATVLGGVSFEDAAAALTFYLDRTGYTLGETTDGVVAISLPRRNVAGTASTVDLGEGNTGVILQLTPDGTNLPADAAAFVQGSMAYTPPPPPEEEAPEEAAAPVLTVLGLALNTDGLSTLATAVVRGGFAGALNGEGSFTVFAPTDAAFDTALEALGLSADELLANRELLSSVLSYHVVDGALTSAELTDGLVLTTLNGATLTVNVADGAVTVTDGQGNVYNVVTADVVASNGVVHVIDGVLMPPSE